MALKDELEEVAKWLAEKLSPTTEQSTPQPLTRKVWQEVGGKLREASKKLEQASEKLEQASQTLKQAPKKRDVLDTADFARDLARETHNLQLRAQLLSRRSPLAHDDATQGGAPPVGSRTDASARTAKDEPSSTRLEAGGQAATALAHAGGKPETTEPADTPAKLAKSAEDAIENARTKLEKPGSSEPVSGAFENDVDVLAEMVLTLRQKLDSDLTQAG